MALITFRELRRLQAERKIEAAQLMVAMNRYMIGYASSLVAATPGALLPKPKKPKVLKGLTADQIALMEEESAKL